jgi:hypothetical protein
VSTLLGLHVKNSGDVNVVFGAPQFRVLKRFATSNRNSGRKRPTGNALKNDKSTFVCAGRRKKLRFVLPNPPRSTPVGCENYDLSYCVAVNVPGSGLPVAFGSLPL